MEPSANQPSADQPKGDLEHLFRQKFADAEVMPRRNVWEQIDHELLVQQNETYRRRLGQHRWLAAACLLLLMAAGLWMLKPGFRHEAATPSVAQQAASSETGQGNSATAATADAALAAQVRPDAVSATAAPANQALAISAGATSPVAADADEPRFDAPANLADESAALAFSSGANRFYSGSVDLGSRAQAPAFARHAALGGYTSGFRADEPAQSHSLLPELLLSRMASLLGAASGSSAPQQLPLDTLHKATLPAGPPMLALQDVEPEPKPRSAGRLWRLSASVAAAAYNPNINFSRSGNISNGLAYSAGPMDFQNVKNASQAALYEQAATEYRQHLESRPGLRGKLGIARPLGKRWELATGVEVAQLAAVSQFNVVTAAYSRSANAFTGSNAAYSQSLTSNANSFQGGTTATRYRYTSAGVPVSVRYGSPKNGLSLYASLGAAVNVLLGSRVEVAGASEATRTYSVSSSDSPYRKVLASLRGGAGARYRAPDGQWSVLVGPEAELGLTTLNADPAQRFLKRSRPYSVGLATSVEFGGGKQAVSR
ncbi:hypothetical protein [Hymenobacter cavernae]|uniref:Outer membrane protein beta-barrel domain-containing protein n=1 Tax=Hymenobacter cavernae TaxID=2044852 RepID=A0ABQ1TLZ4_9BACT|nr:hypothetical protein [Hymenobacter cavernae]GGE98142.1 hypothetical protein GCM10011383_06180 [Hymenobacter cavernae]